MLEFVEEPLDKIALPVDRGVHRALNLPVPLCGNVPAPAMRCDHLHDGAGVIAAIGNYISGSGMRGKQVSDRRLVRGLPGRQRDRHRQSAMINHRIDLGAQSTTRATDGVILARLIPEAACWWTRMIELPMNCMLSGDFFESVSNT